MIIKMVRESPIRWGEVDDDIFSKPPPLKTAFGRGVVEAHHLPETPAQETDDHLT